MFGKIALPDDLSAYAGRWVALLRGQIVGQGGTPAQARYAAQSRFKEVPEIRYVPMNPPLTLPPLIETVLTIFPSDQAVYLVGGAVRDLLLGHASHDFDFVLPREGIEIARRVANALGTAFYPLDAERNTGRVVVAQSRETPIFLDFAVFRGPDLEADLRGRDFTINAMALELRTKSLFDPLGGVSDLHEKRLRACSTSAFVDDPVRILRGVRLAASLGFSILPETRFAMKNATQWLPRVSAERLRDELFRILDAPKVVASLRALDLLGALPYLLPELQTLRDVSQPKPHVQDVWKHTLSTVAHLEHIFTIFSLERASGQKRNLWDKMLVTRLGRYRQALDRHFSRPLPGGRSLQALLFLATLYHDIAKPETAVVDREGRLRFPAHELQGSSQAAARAAALVLSNEEIERLSLLVRYHMRVHFYVHRTLQARELPSRRTIYRFFRDAGPAGIDLCFLALADLRATYETTLPQETWSAALDVVDLLLENWFERSQESICPPPLVNGDELMQALKIPPGPRVGELLDAIREAQAVGEVSTPAQALAYARARLESNGSVPPS